MNFLAHAFLSGDNDELMVGNFIGDFVKGNQINDLPEGIKKGVVLHRGIDEYTDKHTVVKLSKSKLVEKYRHYAGVIVDVFYDHFLATNWNNYHTLSLKDYTEGVYDTVLSFKSILPPKAQHVVPYMKRDNWLLQYASIEGIHNALSGMSRRTKFESKMEQASVNLKEDYSAFQEDFERFFPDLIRFAESKL